MQADYTRWSAAPTMRRGREDVSDLPGPPGNRRIRFDSARLTVVEVAQTLARCSAVPIAKLGVDQMASVRPTATELVVSFQIRFMTFSCLATMRSRFARCRMEFCDCRPLERAGRGAPSTLQGRTKCWLIRSGGSSGCGRP